MSDADRQPTYSLFIEKNNQFNSYFEPFKVRSNQVSIKYILSLKDLCSHAEQIFLFLEQKPTIQESNIH